MRRPRSRSALALAPALALMVASGACTFRPGRERPTLETPPSTAAPRRGGALVYAIADDAGALDPQLASQPSMFALVRATQRGLLAFPAAGDAAHAAADATPAAGDATPTGGAPRPAGAATTPATPGDPLSTPVPDLAESLPAISPDGLVYTFRLREGARFGPPADRPVVAADVKAGLERLVRVGSPLRAYLRSVAGAGDFEAGRAGGIAGVEIPDERTVRIRLARPANDLAWLLAHTAASAVPAGTPVGVAPERLAASGPYRVVRADAGREIRLVRNPAWDAASDPVRGAWVDEIRVVVGDASAADVAGEGLDAPAGMPLHQVASGCLLYLFANPAEGRLASIDLRRALDAAIDRRRVAAGVEAAAPGAAVRPSAALLAAGAAGASRRLLRPVPSGSPSPAPPLRGLSLSLGRETTGPDAAADQAAAAAVAALLEPYGVAVRPVTAAAPGSIYDLYEAGRAPSGIARWCPDWPGRSGRTVIGALLGSAGPANYSRTSDQTLDRLIAAATEAPGAEEIARAWTAAEDRALTLATVLPLAFVDDLVAVAGRVRGFSPHPFFVRGDPTALWLE